MVLTTSTKETLISYIIEYPDIVYFNQYTELKPIIQSAINNGDIIKVDNEIVRNIDCSCDSLVRCQKSQQKFYERYIARYNKDIERAEQIKAISVQMGADNSDNNQIDLSAICQKSIHSSQESINKIKQYIYIINNPENFINNIDLNWFSVI